MAQAEFAFTPVPARGAASSSARADLNACAVSPGSGDADGQVGFDIGWEHARHALVPPAEHLLPGHPVREGWEAGKACFGVRTRQASRSVRLCLGLRLQAWLRGHSFETVQVTPHYLAQIEGPRCPVTREPFSQETGLDLAAQISRLFEGAGFAAGNLVALAPRAARAKAALTWPEALTRAAQARSAADGLHEGLSEGEWARLGSLISMATPLPHAVAATLPLRAMPPNRVRLINPIQGLQVLITLQIAHADWSARINRLAALMPRVEMQRAFHLFFHSLLPRAWCDGLPSQAEALRWRLEDAWQDLRVQRRWERFALLLDADLAEQLQQRALQLGLGGKQVQWQPTERATEGWALEHGGYAHAEVPVPGPQVSRNTPLEARVPPIDRSQFSVLAGRLHS